ncbi:MULTISPECIES: hypothetical protein [unclassified Pseudoalteromonas]|uniref:hypothetical protein n=1 Tax=unclassified Pseudoalteromonas TaxID=194690 RepID=UPI0018CDDC1D|nr:MULTISPECIES: hypothetical protein [unclassified Pseudoalteromonas]MBG9991566.1 hypothetical protein [Pseudoalteromonas sp. NZS37]MBH0088634.1 hypothetical protein [Pseudoalteromonas sp. NSLLW218]
MSNTNSETSPKWLLIVLIALAFVCIGGVYLLWFKGVGVGYGGTTETWSHFGSFFGGVLGPVLSFFSFIGIIYTVYLQSKSNKEQAKANEHTTEAIKSSEILSKENLEEQRKQFKEQIEYDKQQRLLDFLTKILDELESAGGDVYSDFVPKETSAARKLGPHFNLYSWKLRKTCVVVKRLRDKLDIDSARIVNLLLEAVIGQIEGYINAIEQHKNVFINQSDIPQSLIDLETAKKAFSRNLEYLNEKYKLKDENNK